MTGDFDPIELDRSAAERVRGGFHARDDIIQALLDEFEEDVDSGKLRPMAVRATDCAIVDQQRAETSWPPLTDCDRLDVAFEQLEESGIVARQNFTCCQTCGHAEIGDEIDAAEERGIAVRGYAFYHAQDTERAVDGEGVWLAYGALEANETATAKIAQEVVAIIGKCGLKAEWDGSIGSRILVKLEWRRRFPIS